MNQRAWTDDQRRAIEATGRDVVVNAAAGSGKTAVLAERAVRFVAGEGCDSCGVDDLLVVTFTNAAARQMRQRIATRLARAADEANDPGQRDRLLAELAQLPRASVGTLSSFCAALVRRYFHAADADPAFGVLDADQARLLQKDAIEAVVEQRLSRPAPPDDLQVVPREGGDGAGARPEGRGTADRADAESAHTTDTPFARLLDRVFDGDDAKLARAVRDLHALQSRMPDPDRWCDDLRATLADAADGRGAWREAVVALVRDEAGDLAALADAADAARRAASGEAKLAKLSAYAGLYAGRCRRLAAALDAGDFDAAWDVIAEVEAAKNPADGRKREAMPGTRAGTPGRDALKAAVEAARGPFESKAVRSLCDLCCRTWGGAVGSTVESTLELLDITDAFRREYDLRKGRLRVLDFADLERRALLLLERNPDVAADLRRRYVHVLVDESQDIDGLQDALLRRLSRGDNLFVVGDVKQSIYRFRLAEPEMFVERLAGATDEPGEGPLRVDLQRNFRSRAPLLEAVNAAFSRLMGDAGRLDVDYADRHALNADPAKNPPPGGGFRGGPVEVHVLGVQDGGVAAGGADENDEEDDARELERIEREAVLIADRVREFRDGRRIVVGEGGEPEAFDFGHAAVLLRSRQHNAVLLSEALRRNGVPCHCEAGTGFFGAIEVQDVLNLLRLLDNPRQDLPLATVVRSPLSELGLAAEDVLAEAAARARASGERFFEAARRVDALRPLLGRLDAWRLLSRRMPAGELIDRIFRETRYDAYVAGLDGGLQRVANLAEVRRRAGRHDEARGDGLRGFLEIMDALEEAGDLGQPSAAPAGGDVVRVMSVHAAKGLEFPIVFLADCGKRHNARDTSGPVLLDRGVGVAVPAVDDGKRLRYDSPQWLLAKAAIRRASTAEELRVLYVAMTRAKEHLVLVGHADANAEAQAERWAKAAKRTPFDPRDVLAGASFLDWIGMAAAASPEHFDVQHRAANEVAPQPAPPPSEAVPAEVRRLKPLPDKEMATDVAVRLAYDPRSPASVAASTDDVRPDVRPRVRPRLAVPDDGRATLAATRRLARSLDWRDAADAAAVRKQASKLLGSDATIDAEVLVWLAVSEVGDLARSASRLVPSPRFHAPGDAAGPGDLDRPVVRGGGDLLIESTTARPVLVDLDGDPEVLRRRLAVASRALGSPMGGGLWVDLRERKSGRVDPVIP